MAIRHWMLAVTAVGAVATATLAAAPGALTQKQARLQGVAFAGRAVTEQRVGRLIVKFRDGALGGKMQEARTTRIRELAARAGVGMDHARDLAGGASLLSLAAPMTLSEAKRAAARLAADANVEYAEPDVMLKKLAVPNDTRFSEWQWNLFAPGSTYTGGLLSGTGTKSAVATGGANLPTGWDISKGGAPSVVVAVIDTGIVNHPDLNGIGYAAPYTPAGRFVAGYDFVSSDVGATEGLPANFVANDGDGRDADPTDPGDWVTTAEENAYPAVCDDGSPGAQDSSWHGTHMAGIAAATTNNGIGVAGIAWNVRVQPIRALGKCGGSLSDIAEAIQWAAGLDVPGVTRNTTPARVISLSLGGAGPCSDTRTLQAGIDAAIAQGAVVIAATGNEGSTSLIAPANCNGVISVTAHTISGENADYANIGPSTTISAPGGGSPVLSGPADNTDDPDWDGFYIWSTLLYGARDPSSTDAQGRSGPAYGGFTGTSAATPHVAGVAALIKSILPSATAAQVRNYLVGSARPFPAGSACAPGGSFEGSCGAGLLDAAAALNSAALLSPPIVLSGPDSVTLVAGQSASFSVFAAGAPTLAYQWKRNGTDIPGANGPSYTTPALSIGDSGTRYSVTVANGLGTVTSPEATVTVTAAATGGGGGALPLGQLLLLVALLVGTRVRRRE